MNDIQIKQYAHLRNEFDRLRWQILGFDYYTVANDVYGSDTETAEAIRHVYEDVKESRNSWRILALASLAFAIFVSIVLITS